VANLLGTAAAVVAGVLAPVLDVPSDGEPSVLPEEPAHVFPIDGPHDLGRSVTNGFGGGRGHDGQDMFADCGTPIVSASDGTVRRRETGDSEGGNYLVIEGAESGRDYVYMHLQRPPRVRAGERVGAGERLGAVGQTGNAHGCHLHFELWSPPGWQRGAVRDPLPLLREWRGTER